MYLLRIIINIINNYNGQYTNYVKCLVTWFLGHTSASSQDITHTKRLIETLRKLHSLVFSLRKRKIIIKSRKFYFRNKHLNLI